MPLGFAVLRALPLLSAATAKRPKRRVRPRSYLLYARSLLAVLFALVDEREELQHRRLDVDFRLEGVAAAHAHADLVLAGCFAERFLSRLGRGGLLLGHERGQM